MGKLPSWSSNALNVCGLLMKYRWTAQQLCDQSCFDETDVTCACRSHWCSHLWSICFSLRQSCAGYHLSIATWSRQPTRLHPSHRYVTLSNLAVHYNVRAETQSCGSWVWSVCICERLARSLNWGCGRLQLVNIDWTILLSTPCRPPAGMAA